MRRILIVDDHEVVTRGVISILSRRKDLRIINDAEDGQEAVRKAKQEKPDLIIMDVTMPVLDGFGAAKEIRHFLPNVPILFLSVHESRQMVERVKSVGGQGFVAKSDAGTTLLKAVDSLLRNETFFSS
jgi:DNA-binding NarL/FixJ family response regulator